MGLYMVITLFCLSLFTCSLWLFHSSSFRPLPTYSLSTNNLDLYFTEQTEPTRRACIHSHWTDALCFPSGYSTLCLYALNSVLETLPHVSLTQTPEEKEEHNFRLWKTYQSNLVQNAPGQNFQIGKGPLPHPTPLELKWCLQEHQGRHEDGWVDATMVLSGRNRAPSQPHGA